MRILFVNQYYWPDSAATAQMLVDLCEHLAGRGHEVHVLCSRGAYDDGSVVARQSKRTEVRNGVHIWRTSATAFGKKSIVAQGIDFLSFHLFVGLRTLARAIQTDLIVTLTTPPLVQTYGLIAQTLFGVKHVHWVMDLHPDCEFELGMFMREQLLPRMADRLNALVLKRADANVTLGPYMTRRVVAKGVDAAKVHEIPVWGHDLPPAPAGGTLRESLGLSGKFVVMYSGNAGMPHTFDEICQAALRLKDDDRFRFLFIGGGRRLAEVREFSRTHALTNFVFRGYLPREQLGESLRLADVHLITLRKNLAGVSIPCKLYGVMAAGRPALFVGPDESETSAAIREHACGRSVPNGDIDGLVAALKELAESQPLRSELGTQGRRAFESTFNRAACSTQWATLLERVGSRTKQQP